MSVYRVHFEGMLLKMMSLTKNISLKECPSQAHPSKGYFFKKYSSKEHQGYIFKGYFSKRYSSKKIYDISFISSNFPHNSVAFISVHFFFLILYFYLIPTISVLYRTLFFDLRMELSLQNQNSNITIRVLKFSLVCNFVKIVLNEHSDLHFLLCTNVTRRSQTLHAASFKCSKL